MTIHLLDHSMHLDIYIDSADAGFEDDVCLRFIEDCPEDEKVFYGGETQLYITRAQAREIRDALNAVLDESDPS